MSSEAAAKVKQLFHKRFQNTAVTRIFACACVRPLPKLFVAMNISHDAATLGKRELVCDLFVFSFAERTRVAPQVNTTTVVAIPMTTAAVLQAGCRHGHSPTTETVVTPVICTGQHEVFATHAQDLRMAEGAQGNIVVMAPPSYEETMGIMATPSANLQEEVRLPDIIWSQHK